MLGAVMDAAKFEQLREIHIEKIREDLQEATELLCQLNKNLAAWGASTGDTEKLAQVWLQFQSRLLVLSQAFPGLQP